MIRAILWMLAGLAVIAVVAVAWTQVRQMEPAPTPVERVTKPALGS
jgi:hypothetical protein